MSDRRVDVLAERIALSHILSDPTKKLTNDQISFAVGAIHALDWILGVRGQHRATEFLEECASAAAIETARNIYSRSKNT